MKNTRKYSNLRACEIIRPDRFTKLEFRPKFLLSLQFSYSFSFFFNFDKTFLLNFTKNVLVAFEKACKKYFGNLKKIFRKFEKKMFLGKCPCEIFFGNLIFVFEEFKNVFSS